MICAKVTAVKKVLCGLSILASSQVLADDVMVISASGFEQEIQQAPASISVITRKDVENKAYRDVTDALKSVPGVTISGGGAKSDISLRGMDAKYTLILVDGKRVRSREIRPNSDGPGFEQGWLPPLSAIEQIEVIRGPMSSLYGSDAMGGVINIITKKTSNTWIASTRLETLIQEERRSKNSYSAGFSLMGPLVTDTLGLQVYGQYSTRSEDRYLNGFPEQDLRNLNGKLTFTPNDSQQVDLDFSRSLQNSYQTGGRTAANGDSERDNQRNAASVTHHGTWAGGSAVTTLAYETAKNSVRKMQIDNTDIATQFLAPLDAHMLSVGAKFTNQNLHDESNLISVKSDLSQWDYALFVEDEWQLIDKLAITTGLRYNKNEKYGDHWNPRLYGVFNVSENYTVKGGISTGYTTPSLRHVVADWGQPTGGATKYAVILGNPDLKPEKSLNYEMSLNYLNESGTNASVTAFSTQFKDKIQSYYQCDNPVDCDKEMPGKGFDFIQSRHNVDRAVIHGAELALATPLSTQVALSSSYTFMKTKQKTGDHKGLVLNRTPRHKFNTQLDYQFTEKLAFWGKVAYYGQEISLGKKREQDKYFSGYTLWDLGAGYSLNKQMRLYTGIYNLFNKKIDDNDFGKTLDGRRYWLGLDMNF